MSLRELARLEAELERVEERYFAARANGGAPAELELERRKLIEAIVELERKLDPKVRADFEADQEARRRNELTPYQRRREDYLRREWEQWRYARSKLPADERGPMLRVGQRACRWCGDPFEPANLRQRFCDDACRLKHHRASRS